MLVEKSMSEMLKNIEYAFTQEFKAQLEKQVEKSFDEWKKNELPGMIARAANVVSVQLNTTPHNYGRELSFVIRDMQSIREAMNSPSKEVCDE